MKRLLSCSFIFFSAVVCPGREAVVNSPWKIKLYTATGRQRKRAREQGGKKRETGSSGSIVLRKMNVIGSKSRKVFNKYKKTRPLFHPENESLGGYFLIPNQPKIKFNVASCLMK